MKTLICSIMLLNVFLFYCIAQDTIIPCDLSRYNKELKPGITQDKVMEITTKKMDEAKQNTQGKLIPSVFVQNADKKVIELRTLLKKHNILAITATHCSWGKTGLLEDLPKAIKRLEEDNIKCNVICLLVRDTVDQLDTASFNSLLNQLMYVYPVTCIIKKTEADKLNFYASPTRYILDKRGLVSYYSLGVSSSEDGLFNELKGALSTIND